jgi:hypothetical protein
MRLDQNYKRGTSLLMGRPPKNANHPLVRLRRKLSEWSPHQVTRKVLAKRTGIPEASLRDIETGRYKLTYEVATKISFATKVDPRSLLAGDDPVLDLLRQPLSKDSLEWSQYPRSPKEYREARERLLCALLDSAEEKKIVRLVYLSFENWLTTTIEAFGLDDLLARKLIDRFPAFEPDFVPDEFLPKNKRLRDEWLNLEWQIKIEYIRLLDQYVTDNPAHPVFSSSEHHLPMGDLLKLESELKSQLRMQARENVARTRQGDAVKSATP